MNKFELIQPVDAIHYDEFIKNHISWLNVFPIDTPVNIIYDKDVVPSKKDIVFTNVKFTPLKKDALSQSIKMLSVFAEPFAYSNAEYFIKFETDNVVGKKEFNLIEDFNRGLDWKSQTLDKMDEHKFQDLSSYYDVKVKLKYPRPLTNILIYKSSWIKTVCLKTKFQVLPVNSFSVWFWWCSLAFGANYELKDFTKDFNIKHKNLNEVKK